MVCPDRSSVLILNKPSAMNRDEGRQTNMQPDGYGSRIANRIIPFRLKWNEQRGNSWARAGYGVSVRGRICKNGTEEKM